MSADSPGIQYLLTLPPRMAEAFATIAGRPRPRWFACSDTEGAPLGSGGGTANLLFQAWQATGAGQTFQEWLRQDRKLILHAGGQSRRLPAYAPQGKVLMPIPVFRWSRGQRLDQTLLDLAVDDYSRVLTAASPRTALLLTSGDALVRLGAQLPPLPEADVVGLGMWGTPEQARDFGVFFTPRQNPREIALFLQKPAPARIRELAEEHHYLIDTGMWLLSERAVAILLTRCGWDASRERFSGGAASPYEFYACFAPALGRQPSAPDAAIQTLTSAVVPLPEAEFYHFGTSAQMIESVSALQNLVLDETKLGTSGGRRHPDQYLQNTAFKFPLRREENDTLWVENSHIPASWQLASEHVLTGVPENQWELRLERGVCLDFVPVGETGFAIRAYGFRDRFGGALGDASTLWFGKPVVQWFEKRGLTLSDAQLGSETDLQLAALFPVLPVDKIEATFLEWLYAANPARSESLARQWRECPRRSAQELLCQVNLARLQAQRVALRQTCLAPLLRNHRWSVFYRLDLESTADLFAVRSEPLPSVEFNHQDEPLAFVHDRMFRAAVGRRRGESGWEHYEAESFAHLRDLIVREAQLRPAQPRRNVLEDQIVWARSPARLDLGGGWTDTPPYCLEFGGRVVNMAVDLNGQPPVQVFAKLAPARELVIRSIDLGVEERLRTYEELESYAQPGSAFALARAAVALAGFHPRFQSDRTWRSLADQLGDFGGGLEISLLAAVPKGSGLGTSSILAATLLAALSELCGLEWERSVLFTRTLALEQLLTTGGGWQDQAGGLYRGVKLIETAPGLQQKPTLRWFPDYLFGHQFANRSILLYYTGVTRLAKNILAEIVRGIFLNSPRHLRLIAEIGNNADQAAHAIQKCDYAELGDSVRECWRLYQRLDAGTNPAEIQVILNQVQDYLLAAKLLGAGGGGYLVMLAKDEEAGARIRQLLTQHPPNPRARFVDFSLSDTGLQVTRS